MDMSVWITMKPYLAPIWHLIEDKAVTNIMCNEDGSIFYEKGGQMVRATDIVFREDHKRIALQNIARDNNKNIDERYPILNTSLPDGSRIAACSDRVTQRGHSITIRLFPENPFTLQDLEDFGSFPPTLTPVLCGLVREHRNILVVGGTNSGKTTLINALLGEIGGDERVITVEDTRELKISAPNRLQMVTSAALPGGEPISIRSLIEASLRHNPTRIIVGEMRSGEAYDFLQALNSGHSGSMSTVHASTATKGLRRFQDLIMQGEKTLQPNAVRRAIADSLEYIAFQGVGRDGKRGLQELLRVVDYQEDGDLFHIEVVYRQPGYVPRPDRAVRYLAPVEEWRGANDAVNEVETAVA
jgi:pilus assembly protein CpaF